MMNKRYSLIVATSDNMAIGRGNQMPWHISGDLKYFKGLTRNGTVIMGRHTWESLGSKPLPLRENIIVSRSLKIEDTPSMTTPATDTSTKVASSFEEALAIASRDDIFVIGGGEIYRQTIDEASRLYITSVKTIIEDADTFFPKIDSSRWRKIWESEVYHDIKSNYNYQFIQYLHNEY